MRGANRKKIQRSTRENYLANSVDQILGCWINTEFIKAYGYRKRTLRRAYTGVVKLSRPPAGMIMVAKKPFELHVG